MAKSEIQLVPFDHDSLKESLIAYLKTKPDFVNADFEGSGFNTLIDILVRNTVYDSFNANMIANESFLDSAQLRANVSSHAQKLSYLPKSLTASRATIDIEVIPANGSPITEYNITAPAGINFITTHENKAYTFTTKNSIALYYDQSSLSYKAKDVEIYQGQFISAVYEYKNRKIEIPNKNIDLSTLRVLVQESDFTVAYRIADSLSSFGAANAVFFLSENSRGFYEIEFGRGQIGREPSTGASIILEYINAADDFISGSKIFRAATPIDGNSNIVVTTQVYAHGGYKKDSIEDIKFLAPRKYQAQDRALAPIDYETIVKDAFPFLRSIRAWGGEDNVPPRYGSVMLSVVAESGYYITPSLKDEIVSVLRSKGVGSVTPIFIDATTHNLNLTVTYKLSVSNSLIDVALVEASLLSLIQDYSKNNLLRFGEYYNESELIDKIKDDARIETVYINKHVVEYFDTIEFQSVNYDFAFGNELVEGSFSIENFSLTPSVDNERCYDDENGSVVYEYTKDGVIRKSTIGAIDYKTGVVSIVASFRSTIEKAIAKVTPKTVNFYTTNNSVIDIESVKIIRIP